MSIQLAVSADAACGTDALPIFVTSLQWCSPRWGFTAKAVQLSEATGPLKLATGHPTTLACIKSHRGSAPSQRK